MIDLTDLGARARLRPVLYPAALLVAFVLNVLVETAVSPYAATRPLLVAAAAGLAAPWLAGLVFGDRHLAGLAGGVVALMLLAQPSPVIAALGCLALAMVALQRLVMRRGDGRSEPSRRLWPLVTRTLTVGAVVVLIAVGIKAVQLGRVEAMASDLVAEFPLRPGPAANHGARGANLPDVYLILLDGYPRADKLRSEFGIDVSGFTDELGSRGFVVATHSRSNHLTTRLSLAQMFNYTWDAGATASAGLDQLSRHRINNGRFFTEARALGYEVVAVSPGWEHVALRRADHFIDLGLLNDFEMAVLGVTGGGALAHLASPDLFADAHRSRVLRAFDVTEGIARLARASPRFVFAHFPTPHPPLVFEADGTIPRVRGLQLSFEGIEEIRQLGWPEYSRRFGAQLKFLNRRTLQLVDTIVAADPDAVIVVFSDHGLAVSPNQQGGPSSDVDLRTANLLAVRAPGRSGIIDDRSTLANLLPRLLRVYGGTGPADMPETIYAWADEPARSFIFDRPD